MSLRGETNLPGRRKGQDDPEARRPVGKSSEKPVDRASRWREENAAAKPFLLFGESDAFV
jgi:hypothetical protein